MLDNLKSSLIWFALGMIIIGVVGTVGVITWLRGEVTKIAENSFNIDKIVNDPRFIEKVRINSGNSIPNGALILMQGKCPDNYEDLTVFLDNSYIMIDKTVEGDLNIIEGDGHHTHIKDGNHEHKVTGMTAKIGGGERHGSNARNAAHKNNKVPITGTAHQEQSDHEHSGGKHEHHRVGVRACKYTGNKE